MRSIYYYTGKENTEYWALLDELREHGTGKKSEWAGDFLVTTCTMNGKAYRIHEDMDLGIQYKIEIEEA